MEEFFRNVATHPVIHRASTVAQEVAHEAVAQLDGIIHGGGGGAGGGFATPQQRQRSQQQHQPATAASSPGAAPPASVAAMRRLPIISVTAEDLVEPSNRECCICFEE